MKPIIRVSFLLTLFTFIGGLNALAIQRSYEWRFKGMNYNMDLNLNQGAYNYYTAQKRSYDYASFTKESKKHPVVAAITQKLQNGAKQYGLNDWELIEFVTAFVQHLEYQADPPFTEYPKYPIETLVDGGGDCEDLSILLASILDELGYDVKLISPTGHMGVGLACNNCEGDYYKLNGQRYYYIETTATGWEVGEVPTTYAEFPAKLYALNRNEFIEDNDTDQGYAAVNTVDWEDYFQPSTPQPETNKAPKPSAPTTYTSASTKVIIQKSTNARGFVTVTKTTVTEDWINGVWVQNKRVETYYE